MSVHSIAFAHSGPADLLAAAETVAASARANADSLDAEATAFPAADIAALHDAGLLVAPFPTRFGGAGIASGDAATRILRPMLQTIGAASLPLGRLYEGHVNAIGLVAAYGAPEQIAMLRAEAAEGALFGVVGSLVGLGIGSVLALWAVTALAVTGGQKVSQVLPVRWITRLAALVMVVMAGFTLVEALR